MQTPHNTDKVIINDLVVEMSAGIYDHEKKKPQRVIFNIILDVASNHARALNSISDVVSYENICNDVQRICKEKHYELLEELAEIIALSCLNIERVLSVDIKIEKPDIIEFTKSVGIQIFRSN